MLFCQCSCVFENILQHLAPCHSSLGLIFPMRPASVLLCLGEHNPCSKLLHIYDYVRLSAQREGGQRRGEWGVGGKWVNFVCMVPEQHRRKSLITVSQRRRQARIPVDQQTGTMAPGIKEVCRLRCSHQPQESHWLQTASLRYWVGAAGNCWLITIPNCANDRKWVKLASSVNASSMQSYW